jgi:DNA-binding beta-propeller fold protein YncE
MRFTAFFALLSLCAPALGLRLEKKIHLGDTWRLPAVPVAFAYDSRDKTVFIGGTTSDSILVLDERTIEPLGWIDAEAPVPVLVYSSALGKLYCLQNGSVSVYDASTWTRLNTLTAPIRPTEACLDSEDNKLFISSPDSATVAVVDCNSDTVECVLRGLRNWASYNGQSMCYVPGWHRIYCCDYGDSSVVAIDCRGDTLLASIRIAGRPISLCYNSANNRVYVLPGSGPVGIDVASNAIVSSASCMLPAAICCDPYRNRLYGLDAGQNVAVFDCATNSLLTTMVTNEGVDMMTYNAAVDRIYSVSHYGGYLHIFDPEGDTMTERLWSVPHPSAMATTSGDNLMFLAGRGDPGLMVVDGGSDRLIREVSSSYDFGLALADPGLDKVFCLTGAPAGLAIVSGQTGEVKTFVLTGRWPDNLYGDSVNHVIYVREEPSFITAVDGLGDSVVNTIRLDCWGMPPVALCADTRGRKTYVGGLGNELMVFNWSLQSLLATVAVSARVYALVYHESARRVYCGTETGVVEIDCSTDQVTRRVDLDCRITQLCTATIEDRLYCVADTELVTIDCGSAEVVGSAPTPHRGGALYYSPVCDKVYRICDSSVCVYRGTDGHLLTTIETRPLGRPAFDARTNTMMCPSVEDSSVILIDGWSDRIAARLAIGTGSYAIATDGSMPFAFVCGGADITVIRKDTVPPELGVLATAGPGAATLIRDKLYCPSSPGSILMNVVGCRVLGLHTGENYVGGLPAGVYFLVEEPQATNSKPQAFRKIVLVE